MERITLSSLKNLVRNVRRLMPIVWRYIPWIVVGIIVTAIILSAVTYARSGILAVVINQLVAAVETGLVPEIFWLLIAGYILTYLLPDLAGPFSTYLDKRLWQVMEARFTTQFEEKVGSLDVARHENPAFKDLLNSATERGVYPLLNLVSLQEHNLRNIVSITVAGVVLVAIDPLTFVIVLGGVLPVLYVNLLYGRGVYGIFHSEAETRRRYFDVRSHFKGVHRLIELKIFQNVSHFAGIIRELLEDFLGKQKQVEQSRLYWKVGAETFKNVTTALAIVLIIQSVLAGETQIGTMTFLLSSIGGLQAALESFFGSIGNQYEHSSFVTDIFKVLDTESIITTPEDPVDLNVNQVPEIAFEDVSFAYPGTDTMVLEDINLRIAPGEKIALLGENGAGKTTLMKLLCRFYDPTKGRVLVNGTDLREVNLSEWHSMVGALFQDFSTYNFVTHEAIALGRTNGTTPPLEKVIAAATHGDADAFIRKWEDEYDQQIGRMFSGGVEPSKGQRQKLALARVFYREPKVMILDEPTASIDTEAEMRIFERLESDEVEASAFLISHRFSTVRNADRICRLEDGRIAELGTHAELLSEDGTYARLFRKQAKQFQ